MAGSIVSGYGVGDQDIEDLMLSTDAQRKGYCGVSLTNYDNTTVPAIAAGSVVEDNGALYKFSTEESISGSPADGTIYIMLVPSGSSITAEFTATAPTWSDDKQGFYGTGGNANNRYLPFKMIKSGTSYSKKVRFQLTNDPLDKEESFNVVDCYVQNPVDQGTLLSSFTNSSGYPSTGGIFTVTKPCVAYLRLVYNSLASSGGPNTNTGGFMRIQIAQNGTYRDYRNSAQLINYVQNHYLYGIVLIPESYRLYIDPWTWMGTTQYTLHTLYIYATGVYGTSYLESDYIIE